MKTLLTLALFSLSLTTLADESRMTKEQAFKLGYRPVKQSIQKRVADPIPFAKHSIPWPVPFQDDAHTIGNSMSQYQEYGDGEPYWHGGDDLRTARKAWLTTPVSGTLSGGHYTYITNADGSMVKQMKPWPRTGPALYFEISVTTPEGYRFQFHHVDRNTLTPEVLKLLNAGGGQISAGSRIGQVVEWPTEKPYGQRYHHIHYDLVTPDEKELNPEWFSPLVADSTPPTLHGLYARYGQKYEKIIEGSRLARPDELIVASTDVKDGNSYTQPTDYIAINQAGTKTVFWDMRMRLLTPSGKYPDIREQLLEQMRTNDGTLRTQGNYNGDFFLARIPLTKKITGPVELELMDQAGNKTNFRLIIQ